MVRRGRWRRDGGIERQLSGRRGEEDCFLQREDLESATMWFRLGMERLRGFVRETGWRKTF
jgi:hypothetical protein